MIFPPRKIGITDTTWRDGHQSLLATRVKIEDLLPIAEQMDNIGFYSMEVWGGATFDTCLRFLNEDPWERLDKIRQSLRKTKIQMLLRGQNLVGYKNYADDVVEEFVKKVATHGMDIIRLFDAMNDVRNLAKAMEVAKREGIQVQATLCYTISPVHDLAYFLKMAQNLVDMGADSLCVKDMAGILKPDIAFGLVSELKKRFRIPIQMHTHYTSGMASMMYQRAIEAGADVIDTAISSLAMGTSQPATETMVASLADTPYDTGLNLEDLTEIAHYFKEVRQKYKKFDIGSASVDPNVLLYQIPGGMLSNFINQLQEQDATDKLADVLKEVPRVRADLGYPPLVTPTSQIIGSQALLNVLLGRYKMVTKEVRDYVRGMYGTTPVPINEEIRGRIIREEEAITCRPADKIELELPKAREEIGDYARNEEDVLSYAILPQVAKQFLKDRKDCLITEKIALSS